MNIFNFVFTRKVNVMPNEKLSFARQQILKNCNFIVDIGANDGEWIKNVRKKGYHEDALCIEPQKNVFLALKSAGINNTSFLNCAVGNRNGFVYINQTSNNGLSSSILELNSYHVAAAPHVEVIRQEKVRILKLSKILQEVNNKSIFIKIDTQGYELEILKSIDSKSFRKINSFEIEVNLVSTYKSCALMEDVIGFLRNQKFHPFRIENGLGLPNFGQQLQVDILFIRNPNRI